MLAKAAPWSVDTLSPDGWTALHLAAFLGQGGALVALLEHGADARIFGRAFESNLPIHAAAAGRRIDKASFAKLVAATGNPDALQKQGYTALMIAAANGFSDAVDVLAGRRCEQIDQDAGRKNRRRFRAREGPRGVGGAVGLNLQTRVCNLIRSGTGIKI